MAVKVGINGFGRIGRLVFRAMSEEPERFDVVAINDLADADMLAYLLKYDSTQGRFPGKVVAKKDALVVNGKEIQVLSERNPAKLPWKKMAVDVAIEGTGIFTSNKTADKGGYDSHLRRIRRIYRQRVADLRRAVIRFFPTDIRVTDPAGGYLLWIELPETVDALKLYRKALEEGMAITPGHLFSAGDRYRNFIRLNAANWSDEALPSIQRLGRVVDRMVSL